MNGKIDVTGNTKKGKREMFNKRIIIVLFFKVYSIIC